jgi:hypothetical protein
MGEAYACSREVLTPILVRGVFSHQIRARGVKCKEMGLKKPIKCILSKVAAMSAMCSMQKIHFRLKMQAGERLQYSTTKINRWSRSTWSAVIAVNGVARGITSCRVAISRVGRAKGAESSELVKPKVPKSRNPRL